MNKLIFLLTLIIAVNQPLWSQKGIEINGGVCQNNFFDYMNDEGHYRSSYESPNLGYSFGFGVENIMLDSLRLKLRFTLGYTQYGGNVTASDGGLAGDATTDLKIDKSILSLGVYPLNFKLFRRIDINFGAEFSHLIYENFSGTLTGWQWGIPDYEYDIHEKYNKFSSSWYFGLGGRVAFNIKIKENLFISPQYRFYFGLSNEFTEFPETTKSMRHFLSIGIIKKLS